jgi:hypothetical protein
LSSFLPSQFLGLAMAAAMPRRTMALPLAFSSPREVRSAEALAG